jgi:hypothetical protein
VALSCRVVSLLTVIRVLEHMESSLLSRLSVALVRQSETVFDVSFLSSLEGSAVTRARIQGVQHEFTTIPGVVEDVTDICLNLKSLVIKNHSSSSKTLRIEKNTRGVVTGADVICDDQVEVINRDLSYRDDD